MTLLVPLKNEQARHSNQLWRALLELPGQDSNLDKEIQSLLCYRYTTG
jgi:hypothetical protein